MTDSIKYHTGYYYAPVQRFPDRRKVEFGGMNQSFGMGFCGTEKARSVPPLASCSRLGSLFG